MNILKSSNNLWNNFWFFSPSAAAAHRFNSVAREKKCKKSVGFEYKFKLFSLCVITVNKKKYWSEYMHKPLCMYPSLSHSNSYPHLIFIIFMFYLRHLLDISLVFSLSVLSAENVLHVLPFTPNWNKFVLPICLRR